MTYEYKDPKSDGYIQFKISKKDQNRIFKYRKWQWHSNYEYYVKDKTILMHKIPNVFGCIISTILFPVGLLAEGLRNYKETYKDMVLKAWQAKKYGSFSSDAIYKRDNDDGTFDKVIVASKLFKQQ